MNSQQRIPQQIEVTLLVPIDEVDYSHCYNDELAIRGKSHKASLAELDNMIDLTGATYRGELVTFSDSDYLSAEAFIHDNRLGQSTDVQCRAPTNPMPYRPRKKTFRVQNLIKGIAGLAGASVVIIILFSAAGI